jgi:hypothetical protein
VIDPIRAIDVELLVGMRVRANNLGCHLDLQTYPVTMIGNCLMFEGTIFVEHVREIESQEHWCEFHP